MAMNIYIYRLPTEDSLISSSTKNYGQRAIKVAECFTLNQSTPYESTNTEYVYFFQAV